MNIKCLKIVQCLSGLITRPGTIQNARSMCRKKVRPSMGLLGLSLTTFNQNVNILNKVNKINTNYHRSNNLLDFIYFVKHFKYIPNFLKRHSVKIVQNCVLSCEYILAYRARRSQQFVIFYSNIWDDILLRQFVNKLKTPLQKYGKFLLGASLISYDWNRERIPDEDILRHSAEMSLVEFLRDKLKACLKGNKRPADCDCPVCTETDSEWQTFVEEEDIVVWKREDNKHRGKGLYCYKMYARYEDVCAYDFLEAQIDLEYRRTWDTHAVELRLIDSEPATNSDVIYWETKWPKLFSNRDYVFKRRYRIDKKRNLIYLVNQITEHPSCPPLSSKQRVTEYWSYMVIKPHNTFDKPGLEFSLTYFDNPGSNIPSSLTLWATVSGMPDFLKRMRLAALGLAERRSGLPSPLATRDTCVSAWDSLDTPTTRPQHSSDRIRQSLRASLFLF